MTTIHSHVHQSSICASPAVPALPPVSPSQPRVTCLRACRSSPSFFLTLFSSLLRSRHPHRRLSCSSTFSLEVSALCWKQPFFFPFLIFFTPNPFLAQPSNRPANLPPILVRPSPSVAGLTSAAASDRALNPPIFSPLSPSSLCLCLFFTSFIHDQILFLTLASSPYILQRPFSPLTSSSREDRLFSPFIFAETTLHFLAALTHSFAFAAPSSS